MKEVIVESNEIVKKYGDLVAVNGLSFSVFQQEVFGFLGPNGAGKSTTMNMITCYSPLTSGSLKVFGYDVMREPRKVKSMLGVVPQEANLDPDLTVYENLIIYAGYFNIPGAEARTRAMELLEFIQLKEKKDEFIYNLSGGMKRRLLIARALINKPRLLILDEPTTGLDPQSRHLVWERLEMLKRKGVTMIITTHNMEEAERLCDRLIIIDRGRKIAEGTPLHLIQEIAGEDIIEVRGGLEDGELKELVGHDCSMERWESIVYIYSRNGKEIFNRLKGMSGVFLRRANLEDVYLKLTGRALREEN